MSNRLSDRDREASVGRRAARPGGEVGPGPARTGLPRYLGREPMERVAGMLLLLLALFSGASAARASGDRGAFPGLDASARATALGSSLVAWVDGPEANRVNPAGLLLLESREVSFTYADLFGLDLVRQTQVHFGWPFAEIELSQGSEGIRKRRLPPPAKIALGLSASQLRGEAGTETYRESELGASLAWRGWGGALVGAHFRLLSVQSGFESVGADGRALGIGVLRSFGPIRTGLAADNLVSSLDWEQGDDDPLPRRLHLGAVWGGWEDRLRLGTEWSLLGENGKGDAWTAAAEWRAVPSLSLRAGLRRTTDLAGSELEPSAGAGFVWQGLEIDWGFRVSGRDLGTTHRWSASLRL